MENDFKKRCANVVDWYGKRSRLDMFIEEASELIKEICKLRRDFDNRKELLSEIADVKITLEELIQALDYEDEEVDEEVNTKLKVIEFIIQEEKQAIDIRVKQKFDKLKGEI